MKYLILFVLLVALVCIPCEVQADHCNGSCGLRAKAVSVHVLRLAGKVRPFRFVGKLLPRNR